eukprot:TRINITY_DN180_c0_g1_i1.p1 TRINITY_DN180_c0_g1~~TRINITY_DN180_c0_g1_i1.p1  ORF type:complete len:853 (+),score=130.06 TRINITY_DN180_c0_g1_i1:51-2609(+)
MDGEEEGGRLRRLAKYLTRYYVRTGSTETEAAKLAILVPGLGCLMLIQLLVMPYYPYAALASCGLTGCALMWVVLTRVLSERFFIIALIIVGALLAWWDLLGVAHNANRNWALVVCVIDVTLVLELPRYMPSAVVIGTVLWLMVVEAEFYTRAMGLFDIPESRPYAERRAWNDCEKPPCTTGAPEVLISFLGKASVLLLDFYLTRSFADQVLSEKNSMAASVTAAEHVAGLLADFDLLAAAEYLNTQQLPAELKGHFLALLQNLESYRPYLPSELFKYSTPSYESEGLQATDAPVPGMLDGRVALVFTDIRSSTSMWEANESAMQVALDMHNEVIRSAIDAHDGYEVKTIGDAFMVAFQHSVQAVRFGEAVQTALATTAWPEGLARPTAGDGFGLLSIRMGIHCGEARPQRNTLTKRYDYFGPPVNRAARVEPHGAPGAVTVTAEVMEEVGGSAALQEQFIVIPYVEARTGKGLATPLFLTALLPHAAAEAEAAVRGITGARSEAPAKDDPDDSPSRPSTPCSVTTFESGNTTITSVLLRSTPREFTGVRSDSACVGVLKFDFSERVGGGLEAEERAARQLQKVHAAVDLTGGQVSSVVGLVAWVSWGLFGSCPQYLNESARCMLVLKNALRPTGSLPNFHAGLATGPLAAVALSGAPKGPGRRYVTLLGACVEVGEALCHAAAELGVCVLVGGYADAPESHASTVGHVREVDGWEIGKDLSSSVIVEVHELDLETLRQAVADRDNMSRESGVLSDESGRAVPTQRQRPRGRGWSVKTSERSVSSKTLRAASANDLVGGRLAESHNTIPRAASHPDLGTLKDVEVSSLLSLSTARESQTQAPRLGSAFARLR